jgi:RNA polymerase sigma factor (sigma-70 family)
MLPGWPSHHSETIPLMDSEEAQEEVDKRIDLHLPLGKQPITESLPTLTLLERMQQGEAAARDELIRRYWPRLERWARGRLPAAARDLCDTGDLVQETMIGVLGGLEHFTPRHDGALQGYFRAAILNRIRSLTKRAQRRGERIDLDSGIAAVEASPIEQVIGRDTLDRYERALGRLTPGDREAIHLKVELDLPYPEITRGLGKPTITAARMAVSRALFRLAREMQRDD